MNAKNTYEMPKKFKISVKKCKTIADEYEIKDVKLLKKWIEMAMIAKHQFDSEKQTVGRSDDLEDLAESLELSVSKLMKVDNFVKLIEAEFSNAEKEMGTNWSNAIKRLDEIFTNVLYLANLARKGHKVAYKGRSSLPGWYYYFVWWLASNWELDLKRKFTVNFTEHAQPKSQAARFILDCGSAAGLDVTGSSCRTMMRKVRKDFKKRGILR